MIEFFFRKTVHLLWIGYVLAIITSLVLFIVYFHELPTGFRLGSEA